MNQLSLRPLEWYRLALRHGPHLSILSEENYSDGGVALAPNQEIEEEPDLLRAPVLADVRDDRNKLWKHTLTRRHLKPKLLAAWRSHPKAATAAFLDRVWQESKEERVRRRVLELCAECLGRAGAEVVRRAWADYARAKPEMRKVLRQPVFDLEKQAAQFQALIDRSIRVSAAATEDPENDDRLSVGRRAVEEKKKERLAAQRADSGGEDDVEDEESFIHIPELDRAGIRLSDLASASAVCLPAAEGFERVLEALETMPEGRRHGWLGLLAPFRSPRTLDWVEANVERPVTEEWGQLAAFSGLDWGRVVAWLEKGRPMSCVALDALRYLVFHCGDPYDDAYGVRLIDPPDRKTLRKVLKAHAARDPVPRVQDRVDFVLSHPEVLLEGKPFE